MKRTLATVGLAASFLVTARGEDFESLARQMRQAWLNEIVPPLLAAAPRPAYSLPLSFRYPWHADIVTSVFWVGESALSGGGISNRRSAWDPAWVKNYGGEDNPSNRNGFLPAAFTPRQNPFYCALPVTDVVEGHTVLEAAAWIPWFRSAFRQDGVSVLKDRWIVIRHGNRVCYAQVEDCGPFRTDHWQYVFGNERPSPNANQDAGLDVSPAVRDCLGLSGLDVTTWRFVEAAAVPPGPWRVFSTATLARR